MDDADASPRRHQHARVGLAIGRSLLAALWLAEVLLLLDAGGGAAAAAVFQVANPDAWLLAYLTYMLWSPLRDGAAFAHTVRTERDIQRRSSGWCGARWPPRRPLSALRRLLLAVAWWRAVSLILVAAAIAASAAPVTGEPAPLQPALQLLTTHSDAAAVAHESARQCRRTAPALPLPLPLALVLHPVVAPRDCLSAPAYYPTIAASPVAPALLAFVDVASIAVQLATARIARFALDVR